MLQAIAGLGLLGLFSYLVKAYNDAVTIRDHRCWNIFTCSFCVAIMFIPLTAANVFVSLLINRLPVQYKI